MRRAATFAALSPHSNSSDFQILRFSNPQILKSSNPQISDSVSPLHRYLFFLQMQPEGLPAENGDVVDLAADVNASAARRCSGALREHRHFAGSVINLVELERHQGNSPRRGDGAVDVDRVILIPAWIQLE